jgi:hypothetical protein
MDTSLLVGTDLDMESPPPPPEPSSSSSSAYSTDTAVSDFSEDVVSYSTTSTNSSTSSLRPRNDANQFLM